MGGNARFPAFLPFSSLPLPASMWLKLVVSLLVVAAANGFRLQPSPWRAISRLNMGAPVQESNAPGFPYAPKTQVLAPDGGPESFDGSFAYEITDWLAENQRSRHAAVYSIISSEDNAQPRQVNYVGLSANAAIAIACHVKNEGPSAAKSEMMRLVEDWLRELNYMPVGNQEGQEWPQTIKDAAKIRSPMMDLPSTSGEPSDGLVRDLDFTVENVDLVLEEVRPYLISDGGNVKVVDVDAETRVAMLALQGACGSCPSSTTTMQLGIEKVLKENFADFGGVQQVEDPNGASLSDVTTDIVGQLLAPISPAITAMGGMVEVASAFDGIVVLKYKGSPKICSGIEMSLTANPMIREVRFIDF